MYFAQNKSYHMLPTCVFFFFNVFQTVLQERLRVKSLSGTSGLWGLGLPAPHFSTKTTSDLTVIYWVSPWGFFFVSKKELWSQAKSKNPNILEDNVSSLYEQQGSKARPDLGPPDSSPLTATFLSMVCPHWVRVLGPHINCQLKTKEVIFSGNACLWWIKKCYQYC